MLLEFLGFIHWSFTDILDILTVAFVIFFVIRWIRGSSAMNIFIAILVLVLIRIVADALDMKMLAAMLKTIMDVGVIALIVLFQPEIRQSLNRLGRNAVQSSTKVSILNRLLRRNVQSMSSDTVDEITQACSEMGEQKTGALMVLLRKDSLQSIIDTGDVVDANICKRLIMNIFFKNSPLHDGAMILSSNRIIAARCTLPMSDRADIPPQYGMRHKAAMGMSERSDADIIVVSEETGHISFFRAGTITTITNINTLKLLLEGTEDGQEAGSKAGV